MHISHAMVSASDKNIQIKKKIIGKIRDSRDELFVYLKRTI